MDEPAFEAVQRQTEAIVGAIYEASSDEAGNVSIDVSTTIFALALATSHIVSLTPDVTGPQQEPLARTEPQPGAGSSLLPLDRRIRSRMRGMR